MFDPGASRLFALPPGVDFPVQLVAGLKARLKDEPPEAMARVEIYLNTQRMRRRVTEAFLADGAGFLPRLHLVTDLAHDTRFADLPPAVPPLRRRLQMTRLIARLIDLQPDLAPRSAIYDLADSLANLVGELHGEGVSPDAVAGLDVAQFSAHWARTQAFLQIVMPWFDTAAAPDPEARQRQVTERLIALWSTAPPDHPILMAGSTGSRGTTALLMQAVARLPQGAVVLPGFDFEMPAPVWDVMADALTAEDHPQYRYRRLFDLMGAGPGDVRRWTDAAAPVPARSRLLSLALRPAPVTDQWMIEGPGLTDLDAATADVTLIEAPSPRAEALALALVLRRAVEDGKKAALITPDRMLTRQVAAALDRWGIRPDDSAGRPLPLSAPGRLIRHVSALFGQKLTAEALLVLLKHPLVATGADRGNHLRWTRDLELRLRRKGPPFPDGAMLAGWAAARPDDGVADWAAWLAGALTGVDDVGERPLADHLAHLRQLTETLCAGPGGAGAGALWAGAAGEAAATALAGLEAEAPHGGPLTPADFDDLLTGVLQGIEVRDGVRGHPLVRFLGPREAREAAADVILLGGLNDGSWPQLPGPDPWLNRQMRKAAGLLLPERQIGLSAHDFQQAIGHRTVVLSRSLRDSDAETVPSRWLNRLSNLLGGLAAQGGPAALRAMRDRGRHWLDLAAALERPQAAIPAAHRPAPRPPVDHRPRELAVTGISRLIRDPYAIYARHILRLFPLDPLHQSPNARLRGEILHKVLERFIEERPANEPVAKARARLIAVTDTVLAEKAPWPAARALWRARIDRAADWFLELESQRAGVPAIIEREGAIELTDPPFRLTAKPDRIDILPDRRIEIFDYKTGTPPTEKQQLNYDKQLLLEAMMAEEGAFKTLGPVQVAAARYIGLGATPKEVTIELTDEILAQVREDLSRLLNAYRQPGQGYSSRRAVFEVRYPGDYDHLARFGEWEMTDTPKPESVG